MGESAVTAARSAAGQSIFYARIRAGMIGCAAMLVYTLMPVHWRGRAKRRAIVRIARKNHHDFSGAAGPVFAAYPPRKAVEKR